MNSTTVARALVTPIARKLAHRLRLKRRREVALLIEQMVLCHLLGQMYSIRTVALWVTPSGTRTIKRAVIH